MVFILIEGVAKMRTVSPSEYISTPRPTLHWLIDGLIPRPGYMLLLGPPKVGKSFLAWDMACKIASGKSVMGYSCSGGPQKVIYLQLDTKEAAWTLRLKSLADSGYNLEIPNLRLVHPDDMMLPLLITTERGQAFICQLMEIENPALVVLDVLREVHQDDENDSTAMKKVFDCLERAFGNTSVLILHHTRKMSIEDKASPDPVSLARGSSYITGRVDGYWLLYGEGPNRKLFFESRFQESSLTSARQDPSTGLFSFPDLEQDATLTPQLVTICSLNPNRPHTSLWKDASAKYGISRSTYYRLLAGVKCCHIN